MSVVKNFINSEKAIVCLGLIVAASVLTALNHMTIAEWREYTTWIAGIYVGGKSLQGAAAAYANGKTVDVGNLAEELAARLTVDEPEAEDQPEGE
jgi:hypothetical protein